MAITFKWSESTNETETLAPKVTLDVGTAGNDRLVLVNIGMPSAYGHEDGSYEVYVGGKKARHIVTGWEGNGTSSFSANSNTEGLTSLWAIDEVGLGDLEGDQEVTVSIAYGYDKLQAHLFYGARNSIPYDTGNDREAYDSSGTAIRFALKNTAYDLDYLANHLIFGSLYYGNSQSASGPTRDEAWTDLDHTSLANTGSLLSQYAIPGTSGTSAMGADIDTYNSGNTNAFEDNCASVAAAAFVPKPASYTSPEIHNIGSEEFRDDEAGVSITGGGFGATKGTTVVYLADSATYATATKVAQTTTSWSDTAIDFTIDPDTMTGNDFWVFVVKDPSGTPDESNAFKVWVGRYKTGWHSPGKTYQNGTNVSNSVRTNKALYPDGRSFEEVKTVSADSLIDDLNFGATETSYLHAVDFGFDEVIPPGSTILGTEVRIKKGVDGYSSSDVMVDDLLEFRLNDAAHGTDWKDGTTAWPRLVSSFGTGGPGIPYTEYGGPSTRLGGIANTLANFIDDSFGVKIRGTLSTGTFSSIIDHIQIRLHYEAGTDPYIKRLTEKVVWADSTGLHLEGFSFSDTKGTNSLYIASSDTYATATTHELTTTSWSDTEIVFNVSLGDLNKGPAYLFVVYDDGGAGEVVSNALPIEVQDEYAAPTNTLYDFGTQTDTENADWTWVGPDYTGLQAYLTNGAWTWAAQSQTGTGGSVRTDYGTAPATYTMAVDLDETKINVITFHRRMRFNTSEDTILYAEVWDGGAWVIVDQWVGFYYDLTWHQETVVIGSFTNTDLKFRFRIEVDDTDIICEIDEVNIAEHARSSAYLTEYDPGVLVPNSPNVTLSGVNFGSTQGTTVLRLADDEIYSAASFQNQSIDSWSATSIQFDTSLGSLSEGDLWFFVVKDPGGGSEEVSNPLPVRIVSQGIESTVYDFSTFDHPANDDWTFTAHQGNDLQDPPISGYWSWDTGPTLNWSTTGPAEGLGGPDDGYVYTESSTYTGLYTAELSIPNVSTQLRYTVDFNRSMWFTNYPNDILYVEAYDGTQWNDVGQYTGSATDQDWYLENIDISGYTNSDLKIRFKFTNQNGSQDLALDDVAIHRWYSETDVRISGVGAPTIYNNSTGKSVTGLNFNATKGTSILVIGDSATYSSATKVTQTTTSWSDTIIKFTVVPGTLYGDVFMFVVHDPGGGSEEISNAFPFRLEYPTTETKYTFDTATSDIADWTWQAFKNPTTYDGLSATAINGYWCWDSNSTGSSDTGPSSGVDGSPDGYVYCEGTSVYPDNHYTMEYDDTVLDAVDYMYKVGFYRHMWFSGGYDNNPLYLQAWDGTQWVTEGTWYGDATDTGWHYEEVDLSDYDNSDFTFRFSFTNEYYTNDLALDSISVFETERPPAPPSGHTANVPVVSVPISTPVHDVAVADGDIAFVPNLPVTITTPVHQVAVTLPATIGAISHIPMEISSTDVFLWGSDFGATQGNSEVVLGSTAVYATATKVDQTIASWSDTEIVFDTTLGALSLGTLYLYVVTNRGDIDEAVSDPLTVYVFPTYSTTSDYYDFATRTATENADWTFSGPSGSGLQIAGSSGYWSWTDTTTPTSGVGPATAGEESDGYIYTEATGVTHSGTFTMEWGPVNAALNKVAVEFYRAFDINKSGTVPMYLDVWDGDSWENVYGWYDSGSDNSWIKAFIGLDNYTNDDLKLRFRFLTSDDNSDLALDSITVKTRSTATLEEFELGQLWSIGYGPPGTNLTVFEITQDITFTGEDFALELLGYVNAHREIFDLVPIEGLWTGNGPDIATIHSKNQADAEILAHDDVAFPTGYETFDERLDLLRVADGVTVGLENLALAFSSPAYVNEGYTGSSPTDSQYNPVTPYELFNIWKESPEHNTNMLWNWQPDDHPVMAFGLTNTNDTVNSTPGVFVAEYATQLFFGYGAPGDAIMHLFEIGQSWGITPALIETIDQQWTVDANPKVRVQHEATYSIKLSVQHEAGWGNRVAVQHEAPIHYSIAVQHEAPYGMTGDVVAQHEASYDIQEYAFVSVQHEAGYAIRVATQHEAAYDDAPAVQVQHEAQWGDLQSIAIQHEAPYSDFGLVQVQHEALYGDLATVAVQHEAPFSINAPVLVQHEAPYSETTNLVVQHEANWDLSVNNPVAVQHTAFWTMLSDNVITISDPATVTVDGVGVPINECVITSSEGDALWSCRLLLRNIEDYNRFQEGTLFYVDLLGEVYTFQYSTKTSRRDGPAQLDIIIEGASPALVLREPRAELITVSYETPILASAMIEDILGQSVTWDMHDWTIPAFRVAAENAIPLELAKDLVEKAGGVLESNLDGSLRVRQKYLVNLPDYHTVVPDQSYSDTDDNLTVYEQFDLRDGYNRFRVTEADAVFSDVLEFVRDEEDESIGVLRAYPSPWRESIIIRTTDGSGMVFVGNRDWKTREETEVIEFQEGEAQLAFPAESIDAVTWHSVVLGGIILEPYTANLTTDVLVNQGYGLATITYTVKYLEYDTSAILGTSVQYVVEDIS